MFAKLAANDSIIKSPGFWQAEIIRAKSGRSVKTVNEANKVISPAERSQSERSSAAAARSLVES